MQRQNCDYQVWFCVSQYLEITALALPPNNAINCVMITHRMKDLGRNKTEAEGELNSKMASIALVPLSPRIQC